MTAVQPGGGPTVRRILLGSQLRRLREQAGFSREEAGYVIRASESKISRLELGRVSFKMRDLQDLLTHYGVVEEQDRAALVNLALEANTPGWWRRFGDILPNWFEGYVGLESAANQIRTFEVQLIPGLLQTADYARAVTRLSHPNALDEDVESRVSLRMARQELLRQPKPPRLWAVIDESALRRQFGGPAVMRAQLERLVAAAELPNVSLQVLTFQQGGNPGLTGPFTVLRFDEPDLPDVVYLEQLTGALYIDKREEAEQYLEVMSRICVASEPAQNTARILKRIIEETQ